MAEKKYLNLEGLQDVANHVNTRLKTVTTIPASADDGAVRLYVGETSSTYTKGHIYQYNVTDLEWVDITGSSVDSHNVIEGYFNSTDNLFYEESTYTTPIIGASNVIYISLDTDLLYRYNGSIFIRVNEITIDNTLSDTSENPVQNKIINDALSDKADKVISATNGDLASLDNNGNLLDSGIASSNVVVKSVTEGLIKNDGTIDTNTYLTEDDIADKADKVDSATNGDLAGLDANGNLTDSGVLASDVIIKSNTAGLVKNDGAIDTNSYATTTQLADKTDKVANATNGNLAGLDSNGNLTDSGVVANNVIEKVATATGLLRDDGTVDTSTYATTTQLAGKADKVANATANDFATLDSNGNLIDSGINKDIVPNTATSSNKLATNNDLPTELNDLSDDVVVTSPTNGQILKYNATSGKWENQTEQPPVSGATFKGSILFANIPTTGMENGDWYDIKDAFTTDSRFEEGAGIECTAGTDIIWVTDDSKWNILTPSGVNSFNGRLGAVVPASGDYDASDIDYDNTTSGLTSTDVQDAIDELESNKADKSNVPTAYTSNPVMDGTASAGTSTNWAKGDHVHPTDTSRASATDLTNHINNTSNPHSVTASQVGLGSVVNTGDSATPVSGGTTKFTTGGAYTELNKKADKVSSPTNGNFVGMDSNGNLINSGSKASDFSTVKTRQTPTSGGTTLSLVNTGDMYTWNNKSTVSIANSGTASGTAYSQQNITINGNANMINGTRYMELTQDIQSANVFTFSNSVITTNSVIDYYTSDFSVQPSNVSVAAGQCVVTVPAASSSKSLTVRIYIK